MAAFARLPAPEFELVTAGNRLPADRSNVRHLGYATDMRALYGAADLTVLPSHYEPFGLVAAESVQCGTPVVVSAAVGAGEVLGPGDGLVVHSLRPADLADGIAAAARGRLRPGPDFVRRAGLDLAGHVARLGELVSAPGSDR
jgi:glycosyltransferase involved in cell wall biosynthesis